MYRSVTLRFALLLACAFQLSNSIVAQSLAIKKGATNYLVEAIIPASAPLTLQASANMNLWVDLREGISDRETVPFNLTGTAQRTFRLKSPEPVDPIRIVILSDSMASDCCGWGGAIYGYFKPNATIVNYGIAWTSTKIFLQSAEVEKMQLIQPNYVLMQYGYIDGITDPDRGTTEPEFEANLRTIIQMVRDFNGVPILITLHAERRWDVQGRVIEYPQSRNDIVRRLSRELNTPLIDLYYLTLDYFNKLGPDGAAFMEIGWPGDTWHVSPLGARHVSRLVVNALPAALGPYLTDIFDPPPTR